MPRASNGTANGTATGKEKRNTVDPNQLADLLKQFAEGRTSLDEAVMRIAAGPESSGTPQQADSQTEVFATSQVSATAATDEACVDLGRESRCGFPEVVYGPGKSPATVVEVFEALSSDGQPCLATRVDEAQTEAVSRRFPSVIANRTARTLRLLPGDGGQQPSGRVVIVSAGTGDLPVAEEALETARWMNCEADLILDVGVAGPQRLLREIPQIRKADAVVVVAGMEGALPSVVGGHVSVPVFGVPTSVGYGASFGGVAALLSMLNSCAANVAVVNIDAGFKAAYLAGMVARNRSVS